MNSKEKLDDLLNFLFIFSGWYSFMNVLQKGESMLPVEFVAEKTLLCIYGMKSFFKGKKVPLEVIIKGFFSCVAGRFGRNLTESLVVELKKLLKGHEHLLKYDEYSKKGFQEKELKEIYEKIFLIMEMSRNFCEQARSGAPGDINSSLEGLLNLML